MQPIRHEDRSLRRDDEPRSLDLRGRGSGVVDAWDQGALRPRRAAAERALGSSRTRVGRPLPRARAEDPARGPERTRVPAAQRSTSRHSFRRAGSVLVGSMVRRLGSCEAPRSGQPGEHETGTVAPPANVALDLGLASSRSDRARNGNATAVRYGPLDHEGAVTREATGAWPRRSCSRTVRTRITPAPEPEVEVEHVAEAVPMSRGRVGFA